MDCKNTYCIVKLKEENRCVNCDCKGRQYFIFYINAESSILLYKSNFCHKCVIDEMHNFNGFDSIPFRLFLKIAKITPDNRISQIAFSTLEKIKQSNIYNA